MFRRVLVDEWMHSLPMIAFGIFAVIFIVVTVRAVRIKKDKRDHMASLPLDD